MSCLPLSSILFSPVARVYNLRILLLSTIGTILYSGFIERCSLLWSPVKCQAAFACGVIICIHHFFCCFDWRMPVRGMAAIDILLVMLEAGSTIYFFFWSLYSQDAAPPLVFLGTQVGTLVISFVFRFATMMQSTTKITKQRFTLLGYCAAAYPPYNPRSILLNRSLSRPLVRGESRLIILARAFILSCIALGVPAFAIYAIVIKPANTLIYTKNVIYAGSPDPGLDTSTENVTIFVDGFDYVRLKANVSVVQNFGNSTVSCWTSIFNGDGSGPLELICPCKWSDVSTISISVLIPPETSGVFVYLWKGNTLPQGPDGEFYNGTSRINQYHGPASQLGGRLVVHTPLLRGSQLFGLLSWTKRRLITGGGHATVDVYIPQVTGLQPDLSSDTTSANISVLTLRQPFGASVIEYFEETTDDSPLSGVATFGGVWTFVNGAFALFFGANVIYFLFGRRPLSALGIVHILQRGTLVRQWNADFPAIHTEGGLPGSEQAGIVAFIRERLVDLGERPMKFGYEKEDIEAQSLDSRAAHEPESEHEEDTIVKDFAEKHVERGYRLDELPLMDIDLGLGGHFSHK